MAASRSRPDTRWKWAPGKRQPAAAATWLGETIERLRRTNGGGFTAKQIVDRARAQASPGHRLFEWDNSRAGELYRETQAREHVRALIVILPSTDGKEQSAPAAISFGSGQGYIPTQTVLGRTDLRRRLVAQALAEAEAWMARYQHLKELVAVFEAIERVARGSRKKRAA